MYLDVFNKVIDADNTTVGGGSASALSGAMAAGMIGMVAKLSKNKDFGLSDETYDTIALEAEELVQVLLKGSEEDEAAYSGIVAAYRMPKDTERAVEARRRAIREAGYQAALVPRNNGYRNLRVYRLAKRLEGNSNPACASDLLIGRDLAALGVRGCVMNIEANLSMIKDQQRLAQLQTAMTELTEQLL